METAILTRSFSTGTRKNPELALRDALEWWHDADFDHSFEERTIYEWSPRLRELLARDRILKLTEQEFVDAVSRVHAIRDHAIKQENEHLGLPDRPQTGDDKVEKFGEWLWRQRSRQGRTVLDLLNYVVWGNGSVSARLWNAIRSDDWAIPHIGLSRLDEIVGWARPDEFPPRNMRTSKGLRALGYNVRIGVWLRLPTALVGSRSNLYLSPDRTAPAPPLWKLESHQSPSRSRDVDS